MLDTYLFRAINSCAKKSRPLDKSMIVTSNYGRYLYALVIIFLFFSKQSRKVSLHIAASSCLSLLATFLIKILSFKPRPFMTHRVHMLLPSKHDSTFPSKHAILAFSVSSTLLFSKRILGYCMTALSIITGISRIWVGHHYPSDIIGSALLGSLSSWVVNKYWK
ncbi:undecaprenyl-diphosphatase [Bacillus kexueae]|uniref:undecaprenyl-diphosphatase n=1 Tax=Aeribacillus kexueae TaxID=2078952 RepID=UPI001FAED6C0|nr:undecaprenyl-diphosphatase [Bacillus kexueae]